VFPGTAPMIAEDVAAGRLVRLDCDAPALRTNPGLLYLRGRTLAPAALAFMTILRAAETEAEAADRAVTTSASKTTKRTSRTRRRA